jgi:hypothetical protein
VDLCVITKVFCLTNLGLQGCEWSILFR